MTDSELIIDVIKSFKELQSALFQLPAALYHNSDLSCWMPSPVHKKSVRQHGLKIISQLEYQQNQDSRCTIQQTGLIGASTETLELIRVINQAKDTFKHAILALKVAPDTREAPEMILEFEQILNQRSETIKDNLQRIGLARLNLKQCYRHIPLLKDKPGKVSWTWAHTKAIKRITVAQAKQALQKKQAPGIQQQRLKLHELDDNEPLAIVQNIAPHLRANITTQTEQGVKRHMLPGALPIFYPEHSGGELPQVSEAGPKRDKNVHRLTRSDQKLSTEIFLPALRAYRYLS